MATLFIHLKCVLISGPMIGQYIFQTFKLKNICRIDLPLVKLIKVEKLQIMFTRALELWYVICRCSTVLFLVWASALAVNNNNLSCYQVKVIINLTIRQPSMKIYSDLTHKFYCWHIGYPQWFQGQLRYFSSFPKCPQFSKNPSVIQAKYIISDFLDA